MILAMLDDDPILAVTRGIIAGGLAKPPEIIGLGDEEIGELESRLGLALPEMYRRFLRRMGRGAGRFLLGSDLYYPAILNLRQVAERLLVKADLPKLPKDAHVFYLHQGYQFAYFRTGDGVDDPLVSHYAESDPAVTDHDYTFTGFLMAFLLGEVEHIES